MSEIKGFELSTNTKVAMEIPGADITVVFEFPPYSDPDFQKGIKHLLANRFQQKGGGRKVRNRTTDARVDFFDRHCIGATGYLVNGTELMEAKPEGWKQMIPPNHKSTIVGAEFEEKETLTDEEREDLDEASDEQND